MKKHIALIIFLLFPFFYIYAQSPMSGTYTIGAENCDFNNINNAFNALCTNGVSGQTYLLITSSYDSNEEFGQIVLSGIPGASENNNIVLTVDNSIENIEIALNASSVFLFNDVKFFSLQGNGKLTIRNLKESNSDVIIIVNYEPDNSSYISIDGCEIVGGSNSSTTTGIKLFSDENNPSNYNVTIYDNIIRKVGYGIYISNDESNTSGNGKIRIVGNHIGDNRESCRITQAGIFAYSKFNMDITNNKIFNIRGENNVWGVILENPYKIDMQDNLILDVVSTKDSCNAIGLYIDCYSGLEGDILCANNMISHVAGYNANAIYVRNLLEDKNIELYYNSVQMTVDYSKPFFGIEPSSCLLVQENRGSLKVINNIFSNNFGDVYKGKSDRYGSAIAFDSEDNPFSEIVHNIYFTENLSNGYSVRHLDDYLTFEDWSIINDNDTTCLDIDPQFTSNTLLMIKKSNNAGTPILKISKDYFGKLRSTVCPDIGAHEEGNPIGIRNMQKIVFDAFYKDGNIYVKSDKEMDGECILVNTIGQILGKSRIYGKTCTISVSSNLPQGVYVVLFNGKTQNTYSKLFIQ